MFKPALAMDFKPPVYFELRCWNHAHINHWIIAFIGYGDISRQYEPIPWYLQDYDLYKCLSPSSSLKLMLQNDYPFWIFSKAISRRVIKILAYNGGVLNRHRSRAARYLKLWIYLSTDKVFESLK